MQHYENPWSPPDISTLDYQPSRAKRVRIDPDVSREDIHSEQLSTNAHLSYPSFKYSSASSDISRLDDSDTNHLTDYDWSQHDVEGSLSPFDFDSLCEVICFGLVPDVQVRLNKDSNSTLQLNPDPAGLQVSQFTPRWNLSFAENRCDILAPSGHSIAVLNRASTKLLERLWQENALTFELCGRSLRTLRSFRDQSGPIVRCTNVDILAFGFRSHAEDVAAKLATDEVFLQDPYEVPNGLVYENPQLFKVPGAALYTPQTTDTPNLQPGIPVSATSFNNAQSPTEDLEGLLNAFASHNDLIWHDDMVQPGTGRYRLTDLLSHQKKALLFILQQESGSYSSSRALWQGKAVNGSAGTVVYQHSITGAKSPSARETVGGVIADEMGLGKTLTMLSAITDSLDRAFAYARAVTNIDNSGRGTIAAKTTLVIVPSMLLISSWIDEINRHFMPGALPHHKFHGSGRWNKPLDLLHYDIIFTTYGTVTADFARKRSCLHNIHWYRIVLDEAHVVRNASTKQFRAIRSLQSCIRWALTGTPIQNTLDDLASLAGFLRVPLLEEPAQFKRHITGPIKSTIEGSGNDYGNLQKLLAAICLRRTKDILPIAQSTEEVRLIKFNTYEQQDYDRIARLCRDALDLAVSGHATGKAHQIVLNMLLRLRLYCNHGRSFRKSGSELIGDFEDSEEILSLLEQGGVALCAYCDCDVASIMTLDNDEEALLTACRRLVCNSCVAQWKADCNKHKKFLICQSAHSTDAVMEAGLLDASVKVYPSKIKALCHDIQLHEQEGKCIVFSFWKKSLDVVGALLAKQQTVYLRVDGSVPSSRRRLLLRQFQERKDVSVLLMTFGTGAAGLNNLSIANRLHLLEPQWNPSVESQAIGRVVRLGQARPVTVVRYVMKGTVEEHVRRVQTRKHRLVNEGFAQSRQEAKMSSLNRLRELLVPQ